MRLAYTHLAPLATFNLLTSTWPCTLTRFAQEMRERTCYKCVMCISCLNYAAVATLLSRNPACARAYREHVHYPTESDFQALLFSQSATSVIVDVIAFDWQQMCTTWEIFLIADRMIALTIAVTMLTNVWFLPWAHTAAFATELALALTSFVIARRACYKRNALSYVLWHGLWHCLPVVWMVTLLLL